MQIGWPELLLLAVVLIVLFSATARPAGRALRAFLDELRGRLDESKPSASAQSPGSRQKHTQGERHRKKEGPGTKGTQGQTSRETVDEDPYRILNILPGATQEQIRSAYKRLAHMYHPDKVEGLAPEYRQIAERKMKAINNAYEKLMHLSGVDREEER